jgi:hypothetical protein
MEIRLLSEKHFHVKQYKNIHISYEYQCSVEIKLKTLHISKYDIDIQFEFFYNYVALHYMKTNDIKEKTFIRKIDELIDYDSENVESIECFIFYKCLKKKNKMLIAFYRGI